MLYGLQSIHQTDWQGRVELSSEPRTNVTPYSNDLSQWNKSWDVTLGGTIPAPDGVGTLQQLIGDGVHPAGGMYYQYTLGSAGQYYVRALIAQGTDGSVTRLGMYDSAAGQWIGFTSLVWQNGDVSVTGGGATPIIEHLSGGVIQVTVPLTVASAAAGFRTHIRCDDTAAADGSVYVGYVETLDGVGPYIPTTGSPVTVTDYTVDETGSVEVGDAGPSGAELDWTGSAFAGTRIVEANATVFGTKDGSNKNFQLVGEDGYTVTSIHAGWPASLPCPIVTGGANYAPFMDNVVSTQMSTGAPKRRRRFSSVPETFEVKVLLNSEGVSALQTFVKDTLQDVKPFIWKDFRTNQLVSYVFQNRPSYSHASGTKGMWEASLSLRTVT